MKITFIILIFFSWNAFSAETDEFYPESYAKGFHLLAGGGINGSLYNSEIAKHDTGLGLNLKSDIGYYINDQVALEASSNVAFNKVRKNLVWNTLLTVGVRYRFNNFPFTKSKSVYGRLFYGSAPTVIFLHHSPQIYRDTGASRLQYDGPVIGFSLGKMFESKNGKIWFIEYGFSYQYVQHQEGIQDIKDVPTVIFQDVSRYPIKVYALYMSLGVLVF